MAEATPDWAKTEGGTQPAQPTQPAAGGAPGAPGAQQGTGVKDWSTGKVVTVMRIINGINGLGMTVSAVMQVMTGVVSLNFQVLLLSFYVGLFGLLLTCAECHLKFVDNMISKRFGFLFSYLGRSCFILFAGTINFAIDTWIGYLVGGVTIANGIFNFWVIKLHPAFRAAGFTAMSNPYDNYTGGEAEMQAYLRAHPALAQKALSAGVQVAQQNPAMAAKVAGAAVSGARSSQAQGAKNDNPFDMA